MDNVRCGHTAAGNGFTFVCDLPKDHEGWHQQTTQLRESSERTNWGDDGLATWASKDEKHRGTLEVSAREGERG